jgi:hypothetical protein
VMKSSVHRTLFDMAILADELKFPLEPEWELEELLFGLDAVPVPVPVFEVLLATVTWPAMSVMNKKRL